MTLSRTTTFWLVVAAYLALMISASTPSPLYVVYQSEWHFPTSTLTVVFGVYAVALLTSLLTVGGLSDFIGRRPVLVGALGLLAAAMVVFANADGVAWLYVARIMQGLAAGAAIGTLSAAIVSLAPQGRETLAGLLNALIPSIGLGLGALIAGVFAQYAPDPTVLVFVVVAAALAVLAILTAFAHESDGRRPGVLSALVPRMRIRAEVRGHFFRATPSLFAPWAQMGLTLSLLVSLTAVQFGITNHFESGLIVLIVCLAGTLSGYLLRNVPAVQASNVGAVGLIVGVVVTLSGLYADSLTVFVIGSALGGLGLGGSMNGSIRQLSVLPTPSERGEFFAAVYVVGYLSFSIPTVIAGFAAVHFGLLHVAYVYGVGVILLSALVPALSLRTPAATPPPAPADAGSPADSEPVPVGSAARD